MWRISPTWLDSVEGAKQIGWISAIVYDERESLIIRCTFDIDCQSWNLTCEFDGVWQLDQGNIVDNTDGSPFRVNCVFG